MIIPITMYGCQCDRCGRKWTDEANGFVAFTDEISAADSVADDDTWRRDGDKHYCPDCFDVDEEGDFIVKSKL